MSLRVLEGASFVSLERRLLREVTAGADALPVQTRWVATPNATVAAHLRGRLAETARDGCVAGIRVVPLSRFARLLGQQGDAGFGPRWSARLQVELVWLLQQLPRGESRLAEASRNPNFLASLVQALLELGEAGIGLLEDERLEELAEELADIPLAAETVRFFGVWWRHVAAAGLEWEPFSLGQLCRRLREASAPPPLVSERGLPCPVWVHGFYDFIDLNLELVVALARWTDVAVLLPSGGAAASPWYRFAARVAEVLEQRYGSAPRERVTTCVPFEGWPAGAGEGEAQGSGNRDKAERAPGGLTWRRAAGIEAEVVAAAVQVRRWLDEDPALQPHEILVAAPDPQSYLLALQRVFPEFGLPVTLVGVPPLVDRRARELDLLEVLWRSRGSAEALLAWWREYPEALERRGVQLEVLEAKARRLGVSGGLGWRRWSEALAEAPRRENRGSTRCLPDLKPSEIEFLEDLTDTWVCGPEGDESLEIERAAAWLARWRRWLADPAPVDETLNVLASLRGDGRRLHLTPQDLFDLVRQATPPARPADEIDRRGVRFASFMRARAVTARRVVLLGLSVDRFPSPPTEGPLLPEEIRTRLGALARALGFWWRSPAELLDEMRLLLLLLCSAEQVHWVLPELDARGRPTTVTPWLQQLLEVFGSPEGERWRMPAAPRAQAELLWREEPERGSLIPPTWAAFLGFGPEAARSLGPEQSPGAGPGGRACQILPPPEEGSAFSVTQLEILARCPFHFWVSRVLRVDPLEPIPWEGAFALFERGTALHAVLEELSRRAEARGCSLREWIAKHPLEFSSDLLVEAVPRVLTLAPMVQQALWKEVLNLVRRYTDALLQGRCGDGKPLVAEVQLERPWPGRPEWLLTGVVDRVDETAGGIRIIDYKTGGSPFRKNLSLTPGWSAGWYLQPFLYPWLWRGREARPASFTYIYIDTGKVEEIDIAITGGEQEWLEEFGELLASGSLIPTPRETYEGLGVRKADPCSYCRFPSLCRRFERSPREHLAALELLPPRRRRRLAALAAGGEEE